MHSASPPLCPIFYSPQTLLQYMSSSSCVWTFSIFSRLPLPQPCFIQVIVSFHYYVSISTSVSSLTPTSFWSRCRSPSLLLCPSFRLLTVSLWNVPPASYHSCVFPASLRSLITVPALPHQFLFSLSSKLPSTSLTSSFYPTAYPSSVRFSWTTWIEQHVGVQIEKHWQNFTGWL